MSRIKRTRPSPALIVSIIALVTAMSGAAYAATTLPKNSVGTKQLKNNAVTTAKVKNGAITGKKIKTSTLGTVPNASKLGGNGAGSFAKSAQPDFTNASLFSGFAAIPGFAAPGFMKDTLGFVHLTGAMTCTPTSGVAFTLPAADRPAQNLLLPMAVSPNTASAFLEIISTNGSVLAVGGGANHTCGIDGLVFKAG